MAVDLSCYTDQNEFENEACYKAIRYDLGFLDTTKPGHAANYAITDPGTNSDGYLPASYFHLDDTVEAFSRFQIQTSSGNQNRNGFDRNFMYFARYGDTSAYAGDDFSACDTRRDTGSFIQPFCSLVNATSEWEPLWSGKSRVKYHGNAFIAAVCGNFSTPGPGPIPEIYGKKFEDKNGNEIKDAGEGWINGVVIRLYKGNTKLAQTTTSGSGDYSFRLDANDNEEFTGDTTYTIREVVPAGYRQTTPTRSVYVPWDNGGARYRVADIGNQKETDVQITKTAVTDPTTAGLETEWDLVVRNNGPWPAPGVTVSDTFPADYTAITHVSHPQCSAVGLTLSCSLGTLAVNATRTVTVRALSRPDLLPDDGPIVNTGRVDTTMRESDYDNNESSDETPLITSADVSVTKTADATTYHGGDLITYSITVTNDGPSWARKVVATDDVPDRIEILDATSTAPGGCVTTVQDVACDLGTMTVGQQHVITVEGRVRGRHPDDAPPTGHEHLLDVQKVNRTWELEGGDDGSFDLDCGDRGYVTDVLIRVDGVDGGSNADIVRRGAYPTSTTGGRIVLANSASGRAQGKMELVCLRADTVDGNDHQHHVLVDPVRSSTHTLPAKPVDPLDPGGVSTRSVVIDAGLGNHVLAPGYVVTSGSARLMESHLREYGWELVFAVPDGGSDAEVEVSYVPLTGHLSHANASLTHPRHTHELLFTHPEVQATLPPGNSEHVVSCVSTTGKGAKGITATFTYPPDQSAEPVTRRFYVNNPTTAPIKATFDLVCLELQPGPDSDWHWVENTVVVASDTPDDDRSDNTDSVTVLVIVAAEGNTTATPVAPIPISVPKATKRGRTIVARLLTEGTGRARIVAMHRQHPLATSRVRVVSGETERIRLRSKALRRATHIVVHFKGDNVRVRLQRRH